MWIPQFNKMWSRDLTLIIGRRKALTAQPASSSNLTEISRGGTTSTEIRSSSWNYYPPSLPVVVPRENLPTTPLIPYISSSNSNPNLHTIFPLPCDHLLTLIQYNVFRAVLSNMVRPISLQNWCFSLWELRSWELSQVLRQKNKRDPFVCSWDISYPQSSH